MNLDDFKIEEIKDMLYSIEKNICLTNKKGDNLIRAYQSFKIGTVMIGVLSILIIFSKSITPSENQKNSFRIDNEIKINGLDKISNSIEKYNREIKIKDTVHIKIKK